MSERVYNIIEVVGTSPDVTDAAIANAVAEASRSVRHLDWFELQSVRGQIDGDKVAHWQATIKIGFRHET